MRDNGVDIEAATPPRIRTCAKGNTIMVANPGARERGRNLPDRNMKQWVQSEVVGSKELLEQRSALK